MNGDQDWAVALDTQLRLLEWWGSRDGEKYGTGFGQSLVTRYIEHAVEEGRNQGDVIAELVRNNAFAATEIVDHEVAALGQGATYFITEEMSAFVAWAAEALPGDVNLVPSTMPQRTGFVYVEGGIPLADRRGDTFIVKGLTWHTDALSDEWEAETVQGVDYALYSDPLDTRETDPFADDIRKAMRDVYRDHSIPPLWLFHASALRYGARQWPDPEAIVGEVLPGDVLDRYSDDVGAALDLPEPTLETTIDAVRSTVAMERWLVAFWLLVDEPIVDVDHHWPRRALRRRFQRAVPEAPDETTVRVVTLRRAQNPDRANVDTGDGEPVAWSHRWLVRPHWRRLHAGTPQERLTLVSGHIKGPADAPLILRDTVFRWSR